MTEMRLAVNALEEELGATIEFCRQEGVGIEATAFASPASLDEGFSFRLHEHAAKLEGFEPIVVHGPFLDLYATSSDPAIVAICKRRHSRALGAAAKLSASVYVAHLNFLPLIRNESYRNRFVDAVVEFWIPFADAAEANGITIVLENLWEPDPSLQKRVVETANHKALKVSFDNGHALMFSDTPAADWIAVFGSDLAHCHLHDNGGERDDHGPIGSGAEDWSRLFAALQGHSPDALVVLESDSLEYNRKSLKALRELVGR